MEENKFWVTIWSGVFITLICLIITVGYCYHQRSKLMVANGYEQIVSPTVYESQWQKAKLYSECK